MQLLVPHEIFTYATPIESLYSLDEYRSWTSSHMFLPFLTVACYILFIVVGQEVMRDRKAFGLKRELLVWNILLASYSMLALQRAIAFLMHDVNRGLSLRDIVCIVEQDNVAAFWNMAFVVSKFVELGDTFFLVVRKKNIAFLHWYHHTTVLIYTWLINVDNCPLGKFFMVMNVFVHSLMYTYFALTATGIRMPRPVSMTITSLQISQMLGGIFFLSVSTFYALMDDTCIAPPRALWLGFLMYGTYFALFVNFFVSAYLGSALKRADPKSQ